MKNIKRSILSMLLVFVLVLSSFVPVYAASGQGSTKYNQGERDEICTSFDGTTALDYYEGGYEYDYLSTLSSSALQSQLKNLMTSTHSYTSSYDDCHYLADQTDCENGNGKVLLIYTSYSATMDQWNGWNREHVWPKSLGGDTTSGGGADLHHIRPSDQVVNSTRGSLKYGNVDGGKEVTGKNPATGVLGGYYGNGYYEPLDNVKGDVARICLYVWIRWGSNWGATDVTKVFQSVDVLLEWCELDPVDTWEMGRNDVVEDIQGNRNVFIDYPEYAWLVFGRDIPSDMTTPSGEASGNTSGGGSPSCSHAEKTTSTVNATCTVDGKITVTCIACGKVMSSETVKATGHSYSNGSCTKCGAEQGSEATATVLISDYASANNWSDATKYTTLKVDENITATVTGGDNSGKYYTNGNNWRLYQSESATLTIAANNGCTIKSVKITYVSHNSGVLKNGSSTVTSGTAFDVNSSSITLSVENSGSGTSGQARITGIEVIYDLSSGSTPCQHTNTSTSTTNATCTTDGKTTVTCDDCGEVVSTTNIPATGHNYVGSSCTKCGATLQTNVCTFISPDGVEQEIEFTNGQITMPSAPTLSGTYAKSYVFAGWSKATVSDTTTAPTLYSAGSTVSISGDTTFYAVYSYSTVVTTPQTESKYSKYTGDITEGNYLIVYEGGAMKAEVSSSRLAYKDITVSGDNISGTPDASIIWKVEKNGNYWTLYNESTGKYAAGTGAKNKANLITNVTDYAKWTASGNSTYEFVNLGNANAGVNKNLRRNETYGFACYSTSTGGALTLYKETSGGTQTTTVTTYTTNLERLDAPCPHTGTTTSTVNATCTADGKITVTCTACGTTISTEVIPAKGHIEVTDNAVAPTCTESGLSEGKHCSVCNTVTVEQTTVSAKGHDIVDGVCTRCSYAEPTPDPTPSGWTLVTDVSSLKAGDTIIIVAKDSLYALSTEQKNNNRGQVSVSKSGNTVSFTTDVQKITLGAGTKSGTFSFHVGDGYLYAASSGSNYLRTESTLSDNSSWKITIASDGTASVIAQGTNTRNILRYNSTSSLFACYASGQQDIVIYKLNEDKPESNEVKISAASMTVGSTLAMNYYVSGFEDTDCYMVFVMNGVSSEHIVGTEKDGYLVFTFTNIAPQFMTDNISATLYSSEGEVLDTHSEYSIKEYATRIMTKHSTNSELMDLVADMLRYGAAAQMYKNYKTDSLVTNGLDLEGLGSTKSPTSSDSISSLVTEDGRDTSKYSFNFVGVRFDYDNKIYVKFIAENLGNVKITFNGDDLTSEATLVDGQYVIYSDSISAIKFDKAYTVKMYVNGALHQTITYSVNSYAFAKQDSDTEDLGQLVLALYRYGISAKEYNS